MSKFYQGLFIFIILGLLWIFFRAAYPLSPPVLKEKFSVCDITDNKSWEKLQPQEVNIQFKNEKNYLQVIINKFESSAFKQSFQASLIEKPQNKTDNIAFYCKTFIPMGVLYKANKINAVIRADQKIDLKVSLWRSLFGGIETESKLEPKGNNEFVLISGQLEKKDKPKINWLMGDYNQVGFVINSDNIRGKLIIEIEKVYLE